MSVDQFLIKEGVGTIKPVDYRGAEVTWEMPFEWRDPRAGPGTVSVCEGKFLVAFPPDDKMLDDRLNHLSEGDIIRVTGTLQDRFVPAYRSLRGTPVLVATDFQVLQRGR